MIIDRKKLVLKSYEELELEENKHLTMSNVDEMGFTDLKSMVDDSKPADAVWTGAEWLAINYEDALEVFPVLIADAFVSHFGKNPNQYQRQNIVKEFERVFLQAVCYNYENNPR